MIDAFEAFNTVSVAFLGIKSSYDNAHCGTQGSRLLRKSVSILLYLASSKELEANSGWLDLKDWEYKSLPPHSVSSLTLRSLLKARLKSKFNRTANSSSMLTVYSDNRRSIIGVSDVEESAQSIQVSLEESGKCQLFIICI
jgi:hypothetical protein